MKRLSLMLVAAMLGFVACFAPAASAQGRRAGPGAARRPPERPTAPKANVTPNPSNELDRFERMSPEERQIELQNLPPERRKQIEDRLSRLSKLTPEQRTKLQKRYQAFQNLPPDRQQALREQLGQMRNMSEADRRALMNSPEFKKKFSKSERQILQEVSGAPPAGSSFL